ncbi:hypothetical protein [Lactobacillus sp. CBA3605] [Lactiplantibacillus mudanjiangensis]|uniref:hypothetical protein n=1 Tax=Lactiplantibacillus mudanjiangensis TaxID=1296538 RepID=UPI001014FBE7|nr:hypothetical protein [Lactobacillus sp. CBA3605] [Lactiplantibacillus mudanjiangensis]
MPIIKTTDLTKILPQPTNACPVILGITGRVASGKTTLARQLQQAYQQCWPALNCVLVSTDDFLRSNAELQRFQLSDKKGFPISYDKQLVWQFVMAIKHDQAITLPTYNHATNDIDRQAQKVVYQPDILIIEGLMVLQPMFRQLLTSSLFLDVEPTDNYQWYLQRCAHLNLAGQQGLTWAEFEPRARRSWIEINERNFNENVAPLRSLSAWQVHMNADHQLTWLEPSQSTVAAVAQA